MNGTMKIAYLLAAQAVISSDPRFLIVDEASEITPDMYDALKSMLPEPPLPNTFKAPRTRQQQNEIATFGHTLPRHSRKKMRVWNGQRNTTTSLQKARSARSRI